MMLRLIQGWEGPSSGPCLTPLPSYPLDICRMGSHSCDGAGRQPGQRSDLARSIQKPADIPNGKLETETSEQVLLKCRQIWSTETKRRSKFNLRWTTEWMASIYMSIPADPFKGAEAVKRVNDKTTPDTHLEAGGGSLGRIGTFTKDSTEKRHSLYTLVWANEDHWPLFTP